MDIITRTRQLLGEDVPEDIVLYRGLKEGGEGKYIGQYYTVDLEVAKKYGEKIIKKTLNKNAKILDLSDTEDFYSFMANNGLVDPEDVDAENYIKSGQLYQYDGSGNTENKLIAKAHSKKYDVLKIPDNLGSKIDNTAWIVLNDKVLK